MRRSVRVQFIIVRGIRYIVSPIICKYLPLQNTDEEDGVDGLEEPAIGTEDELSPMFRSIT